MSVKLIVKCRKHPEYRGLQQPRVDEDSCACYSLYKLVNMIHPPGLIVERIVTKKGDE